MARSRVRYNASPQAMIDVQDMLSRVWENLMARPNSPLAFCFLMQPAMATILAIRDGIKDVQTGRSPCFWTVLTKPEERGGRLREGLAATAKIMILAIVLDAILSIQGARKILPWRGADRGGAARQRIAHWWAGRSPTEASCHAPHHVPKEWADKYKGKFDQGWDKLREEIFARQKKLKVIPANAELTKRHEEIPA